LFAYERVGLTQWQRPIVDKQNIVVNDNLVGVVPVRVLRAFRRGAANVTSIREVATSDLNLTPESGKLVLNSGIYLPSADNAYSQIADCERPKSLADRAGRSVRSSSAGAVAIGTPNLGFAGLTLPPEALTSCRSSPHGQRFQDCRITSDRSLDGRNRRYRHRRVQRVQGSSPRGERSRTPGLALRVQAGKK
jgi:hypothetical protein